MLMTRPCVANKNHVTSSKVKVIVCMKTLFIGYNENLLYPAHGFVLHCGILELYGNMLRPAVACKDHVTTLKVTVTIQTYGMLYD